MRFGCLIESPVVSACIILSCITHVVWCYCNNTACYSYVLYTIFPRISGCIFCNVNSFGFCNNFARVIIRISRTTTVCTCTIFKVVLKSWESFFFSLWCSPSFCEGSSVSFNTGNSALYSSCYCRVNSCSCSFNVACIVAASSCCYARCITGPCVGYSAPSMVDCFGFFCVRISAITCVSIKSVFCTSRSCCYSLSKWVFFLSIYFFATYALVPVMCVVMYWNVVCVVYMTCCCCNYIITNSTFYRIIFGSRSSVWCMSCNVAINATAVWTYVPVTCCVFFPSGAVIVIKLSNLTFASLPSRKIGNFVFAISIGEELFTFARIVILPTIFCAGSSLSVNLNACVCMFRLRGSCCLIYYLDCGNFDLSIISGFISIANNKFSCRSIYFYYSTRLISSTIVK